MPGQTTQEARRLGAHIAAGLKKAGEVLGKATDDFVDGAKEVGAELKATAKDAKSYVESEVLPEAGRLANKAAVHGGLTARRVGAEVLEAVGDKDTLAKQKQHEFELAGMVVNQKVHLHSTTRSFLLSAAAVLPNFDNTKEQIKGIALFPKEKDQAILQNDFVPVRVFVSSDGLTARVYEQNPASVKEPNKPRYTFKEQRAATAQDLFELQLSSQEIIAAIDQFRGSKRFTEFTAKK